MAFQPNFRVINVSFNDLTSASMSSDIESDIIFSPCHSLAVQAIYTGSPVGTLKIQYSLDKINWSDLPNSGEGVNGAGNTIWNISDHAVLYARVTYARQTGTGILTLKAYGKGI